MENIELSVSKKYIIWKYIGLIIGLLWFGLTLYSRINGPFFESEKLTTVAGIQLITSIVALILRVFAAIICFSLAKAEVLPFNKYLWTTFALILPHIALIIGGALPVKKYIIDLKKYEYLSKYFYVLKSYIKKININKVLIAFVILIIVIFTHVLVGGILISSLISYFLYSNYRNIRFVNVEYEELNALIKSPRCHLGWFLLGLIMFLGSVIAIVSIWSSLYTENKIELTLENLFLFISILVYIVLLTSLFIILGYFGLRNIISNFIIYPIVKEFEKYELALFIAPSYDEILEINKTEGINEDLNIVEQKAYRYRMIHFKRKEWFLRVKKTIELFVKLEESSFWRKEN